MGFPIHVCELQQTAMPDANGDFLLPFPGDTAAEDPFSQVQMFYHTNRAYDFFRGFKPTFDVNPNISSPMTAISNLRVPDFNDFANIGNVNSPLVPFQNAFFSPEDQLFSSIFGTTGPAMYFGQGPKRDYGYDGDVVYHEFTHGVVAATLNLMGTAHLDKYGASVSNGGMNEGLADYFSSAITGDPDVGEYAAKDFDASLSAIRSLTNPDKMPAAVGGEVHQDATFFSGSLWDVRSKLSVTQANTFDAAIFAALDKAPAPADLGYEELAETFVKSVASSPLGQTVADQLSAAFTARGVLPEALRILEFEGKTLNGPQELGGGLWFALGTDITQTKGYAPGVVQVHAALPERTTSITVSFEKIELAQNPLGGGGTPFAPKLLVKFSADPITFSDFTPTTPEGDVMVIDPKPAGSSYSAEVTAPEGAVSVYFMIGNSGQTDGAYQTIDMTSVQAPDPTTAGAGGAGGAGAGGSSGSDGASVTEDEGGCGCVVPGAADRSTSTFFAAAAGVALAWMRRRHARRARRA
jgi:hypothetical protein